MSKIVLTFDVVKEFIDICKKNCTKMQENQSFIETSYLKLGEEWNDNIYDLTGETLLVTGKYSSKIYEFIMKSLNGLVTFYNEMCDYNNTPQKKIYNIRIEPFVCKIRKGEKMKIDINTDPEALKRFHGQLAQYIDSISSLVRQIEDDYSSIRPYWDGKQYRQFGQEIQEYKVSIKKQLQSLELCNELIFRKYNQIVELLGK